MGEASGCPAEHEPPTKSETLKTVPVVIEEVIAMPLIDGTKLDRQIEDESRLLEVALENLYDCAQDNTETTSAPVADTHSGRRISNKRKKSRKERNKQRERMLSGLHVPYLPDLPAMVARTVSKLEAKTNPKCKEALDKAWKS